MTEDKKGEKQEIDLTLLANFTHQVINPLNGVAGTLDNLIDGTIQEGRREQRTRAARAQLEGVITLVRNLAYLSSAQFEAGLPGRKIVLPQVIIEAAMYYQEEGSRRRISIDLMNRADQNKVPGHPEVLRQVLMNMFDNSIKYSKFGSRVEVRQWIQSGSNDAIICIRNVPERDITQDDLKRLFDLGFRGTNAQAVIASGTGLGLYICRYLMENRMNGTITVQRDLDGILFMLRIANGEAE